MKTSKDMFLHELAEMYQAERRLTDALLMVLEVVCKKGSEPGGVPGTRPGIEGARGGLDSNGLPDLAPGPIDRALPRAATLRRGTGAAPTAGGTFVEASPVIDTGGLPSRCAR